MGAFTPIPPPSRPDVYSAVYEALDDAVAECTCLASSEARIQRALLHFRAEKADQDITAELERISIAMQRLSLASRSSDDDARTTAVADLRESADRWMHRLPISCSLG